LFNQSKAFRQIMCENFGTKSRARLKNELRAHVASVGGGDLNTSEADIVGLKTI
jgi:hypothetical protein